MKTLWNPWRMEHVSGQAEKISGCLFEPKGQARHDKHQLLLYRSAFVVVLLNRFPYSNGHLLVAPTKHVACITELDQEANSRLAAMVKHSVAIIKKIFTPDGVNVGLNIGSAAGAGIEAHLHYHIIPRWEGDHNFMTVIGEIRSIPEHIDHTFQRLLPEFNSLD